MAITVALNALDGFDVLSISFASPGIATEWGIDRAALGIVLSMELIGMAVGSVLLGGVADRIGRRPTILGCLVVMATGMVMATTVSGLAGLSTWRVVTGLGIGGMLAAINAVVDGVLEHPAAAPQRVDHVHRLSARRRARRPGRRAAAAGQRLALGVLLRRGVTAVLIPLVFFFVPESVHWLARKQPGSARADQPHAGAHGPRRPSTGCPTIPAEARNRSFADIFAAQHARGHGHRDVGLLSSTSRRSTSS